VSYYKLLGLEREPFSTSPDPHFFFLSAAHRAALYRLRIAVRLQRGLCLVLGDVGTGKTTLSRRLAQVLPGDGPIDLHVVLNPYFESDQQFLLALMEAFHLEVATPPPPLRTMLSAIERYLFNRGVEGGRTVTLLIDEAQQLLPSNLELLRALLNYETHDTKLLQLILMAQLEYLPTLRAIRNLWDRISLRYVLNPLDERETKELIGFRLRQAGFTDREPLFAEEAIREIYYATQGYPRRIAMLCHDALERLVMEQQSVVSAALIRGLIASDQELRAAPLAASSAMRPTGAVA
jgi:general secretion pathway protein A